ncbi:sphingomyelin synthetase family protein [Artemisia annua]|uniref:Sphingomyelin synthetase family protein n=1 Tax=Artemisia annua TaxID=35608 RepID=A0A2U1M2E1_ARTAN|nr:sphingomyelin synthetase family protein [Artemisia annua]
MCSRVISLKKRRSRGGGLGVVAVAYIGVDYVRHLSPSWHEEVIQPLLWVVLAIVAITRVPSYKHWSAELRYSLVFIGSLVLMLSTLLYEMISVRSVTALLGLNWHQTMIDKQTQSLLEKLGSNYEEYLKAYILPDKDIYGACITVEVSSLHGFQSRYGQCDYKYEDVSNLV